MRSIDGSDLLKKFTINSNGQRIPEKDCDNFPVMVSIRDVKQAIRDMPTIELQHDERKCEWKRKAEAMERAMRAFEHTIGIFSFACFSCIYKDEDDIHKCDLLGDEVCEDLENWEFDLERFCGNEEEQL